MQKRYRISIPLETVVRATIEQSRGYGVSNNLQLDNVLRTRVESTQTIEGRSGTLGIARYIDMEIVADDRTDAIMQAVSIAKLFIQLVALVYGAEFEINLENIQAINLEANAGLEPSSYLGIQSDIASFEPLLPVWKRVALLKEQNSELWDTLQLALEWVHLGAIASDDRNIFMAYRIALEILMNYALKDDKEEITVLNTFLDDKMHKKLINVIRGLLSLFIEKPEIIDRVISHVNDTRLKSEADRWAEILNKAGVFVSSQELKDLNIARGGVVHTGIGRSTMSKTRMREIVVAYINTLLEIEKSE
jgi:hypothetical protein